MQQFRLSWQTLFCVAVLAVMGCGDGTEDDVFMENEQDISVQSQGLISSVQIKSADLLVLRGGCYSSSGYLHWKYPVSTCYGPYMFGNQLSAPYKKSLPKGSIAATQVGEPSGVEKLDGQCVSFVKSLANRSMPATGQWIKGAKVISSGVSVGTVIATFRNGISYDQDGNDHTGFFAGYLGNGCFMMHDQNFARDKLVQKHQVCGTSGYFAADKFYVVSLP